MRHTLRLLLVIVIILLPAAMAGSAIAQTTATSSITGVVVDADGGVVPGATVTVKSESTGAESTAVTSSTGSFNVPALNPGAYTVTVSLQSFKTAVLKGVQVSAGSPASVRVKLEIGGLSETVEVVGGAQIVQTQSAAVSTTINTNSILNLPVSSNRSALDFVQFLPGVQTASTVRNSTVNGLPQSSISISLDGANIQDNTLKTSDGFFAIVTPRLDAIEEVTLTSAAQGAEANGGGSVQIKFTTRSGSNTFVGSGYYFLQDDSLNSNMYANKVRGLPKGEDKLIQPGFRQGGPVVIPGLYDGRSKLFFFVNYEQSRSPGTITTNSNLLLPSAQAGIFTYTGGSRDLYALAAANGHTATPDPIIARLLQDIRTAAGGTGTLSPISGSFNTERFSFQQRADDLSHYPTVRVDYNLSNRHRASLTWYRQVFPNTVDTTNTRQNTFPGFPAFGVQGSLRKAYTGAVRSTLTNNLVNEARLAYSGAPVYFNPNANLGMYSGALANQGGFNLQISAAGITNAGPNLGPSGRDATTITLTDTVNWSKGSHNFAFGGDFGRYDVWSGTYSSSIPPTVNFGVPTGDPALAMFSTANFPGSSTAERNSAAALYAVLVGRITSINATARLDAGTNKYVYQGDNLAQGRLQEADLFVQDAWRLRPNLSVNVGVRYVLQLPFYALNSSYSTTTLADVWGISGYKPGCDLSYPTAAACNLFHPGNTVSMTPSYQNLERGVKAYNTDLNNFAPSVGVNWTPTVNSGFLRKVFGNSGDTALSAGYSRAYERHGMSDFTGVFGANPGLSINANRNVASGNLTIPLLFRDGNLGPPATCPPLPAVKPTGCLLAAPEYPLTNQTATSSINMFDPNLQVPYADTWTAGVQRAVGKLSAVEVRYIGTRNREQWRTYDYNEANILDNGFLSEFKLAQANLQSHIASGCGTTSNPCSFAYRGPGTGTSPLPIYLAFFTATPLAQAGDQTKYTGTNWTSSNFVNPLGLINSNPFTPAGTNANTGLAGDPQRQLNSIAAGLPANFFRVNPDMLGGARATGNGDFRKANQVQVLYRRRLSGGLQFDGSYVFSRASSSQRFSFRVPRDVIRTTGGEGDVTHGIKLTSVYDLPFGKGRHFLTNVGGWMDGVVGGWQLSGTMRLQSGRLFDLGNVRVMGMSEKDAQKLFKLRFDGPTLIYAWPQDVIDNTIKAYSVSATTLDGYGTLGPPTGRYFAPANGPDCLETIAATYGECGVRTLILTGPRLQNIDMSLRKKFNIARRNVWYELSFDVFNVLNHVNFTPTVGVGGTQLSSYEAALPTSRRVIQIGNRINW